jgi:hypothetical protein
VPGYKIILQANDIFYEMRTNEDGSQVVQVDSVVTYASVEEMLVNRLASNLGLDASEVTVVSASDVEFRDACLDVVLPDVLCAQMATSGKLIVLEADGVNYEYHTNVDGSFVQPASLALIWKREGGIAGFCDSLMVFYSGEIIGNQCQSQPGGAMGTFANLLSASERKQLTKWMNDFGDVSLDASDPDGVSDRMVVTLQFFGNGIRSLKQADEQDLLLWAQTIFQKLYS